MGCGGEVNRSYEVMVLSLLEDVITEHILCFVSVPHDFVPGFRNVAKKTERKEGRGVPSIDQSIMASIACLCLTIIIYDLLIYVVLPISHWLNWLKSI